MFRRSFLLLALSGLVACETGGSGNNNPGDGSKAFRINRIAKDKLQFRHLDAVNAVRQSRGLVPLELSGELNAAATAHAADMSKQNRPWHFGSDGSSPLDRVQRYGYAGEFTGENISETFEDDYNTLNAWMSDSLSAQSILDPNARFMGIGWKQDSNYKIWWVQVFGS